VKRLFWQGSLLFLSITMASNALDLKEAVLKVLSENPQIQERVKNYNATIQDIKIAKSTWLPTLDYVGDIGYEKVNNSATAFKDKSSHIYEHSLIFIENIFNGWSTTYRIKTQEARAAAAAYNYIEKANDVSYKLVNYYIQVIKNKDLLDIAEQNIKINDTIQKKVKKLYDAGLTTKSELEKANASLALAKSNYIVQENNLKDSVYQLKYYFGLKVKPEELKKPEFNYELPVNYEMGRQYATKHNPSILVQSYNIKVAQADRLEKRSQYYPKIDLEARQSWSENTGGIDGRDRRFRAVVKVSWNLFKGFADERNLQKGISKINQEVQIKNDLIRQTVESYDLSWNAYTELSKQLKHLKDYKKYAVSTLRLYSKEYDMGRRSLLDLLSAQNDLINAKSQIVTAKSNLLFAKYRILDAMGIMVKSIIGDTKPVYQKVQYIDFEKNLPDKKPVDKIKSNDDFIKALEKNRKK